MLLNPRLDKVRRERVLDADFPDLPGHVWLATSGTTGKFKLVALSQSAIEASAAAVNRHLDVSAEDCWLNPLPLFHVGGLAIPVRAALSGNRCVTLKDWSAQGFIREATESGATLSALVPAQVYDLANALTFCPPNLRAVIVGGGVLGETLRLLAAEFGWPLLPSYGMTETCSQVATAKPGSAVVDWLPLLDHVEARVGEGGVLELRGPSLLTGWMVFKSEGPPTWEDPKKDGWFRTGDLAELREGQLRFLGRADDLVKIRGELVDVPALERELQTRVDSGLVRIDVESDERNGALLTVVSENASAEVQAREAEEIFPPYARPSAYGTGPVPVSALGKKIHPKH